MDIGTEEEEYVIEPLEDPVPREEPVEDPEPVEIPELVPAEFHEFQSWPRSWVTLPVGNLPTLGGQGREVEGAPARWAS